MAPASAPYVRRTPQKFEKYGLKWDLVSDPVAIEMHMIQKGGQWRHTNGEMVGRGLFYHFVQFESLLWPHKKWHRWSEIILENYLKYRSIGCIGPASSGKTFCFATDALADYYCFSDSTTLLICSYTIETLEQRIWGEIKRHHAIAKRARSWIAGNIIESRRRIVTDDRSEASEGRDFRNGVLGIPCQKGNDFVGLGNFVGIKNKRVRLIADELQLLNRVFVDAFSNLDKNPDFKGIGLGNPKDTTDSLGVMCEPSAEMGGWDGGIDQQPGTKTWPTRRPQGICIQLPGSDSPNLDGNLGVDLISRADIERDVAFYGTDSLWVSMMDEGKMTRGQGSRRVLTRNMCIKHRAMEEPVWRNSRRTRLACVDAAYKGVGGDRCVYAEMEFGDESDTTQDLGTQTVELLVNQGRTSLPTRPILALVSMEIIPIQGSGKEEAEEQIVEFVQSHCTASGIPPERFFYDAGMRTGLVSAFGRIWSPFTVSIDFGGPASEKQVSEQIPVLCRDYYYNFVTELWYSARNLVESEQARGMTEDIILEFSQREWGMVGKNKIQVEPKADMKRKTGRSPDLADCYCIGLEGARRLGFVIKNLGKQATVERGDWMKPLTGKVRKSIREFSLNYDA